MKTVGMSFSKLYIGSFYVKLLSRVIGSETFKDNLIFLCGLFYDTLSNTDHIWPSVGITRG
jgi:hypothetical protein